MGKHPSLHTFISHLKVEFLEAVNDCDATSNGKNPVKSVPHSKSVRTIKQRENLMENLGTGMTDLLTFQKSIGGQSSILLVVCWEKMTTMKMRRCPNSARKRMWRLWFLP